MRHLRQCERLAEIAMELTEAARVEALKEFQPPAPRRGFAAFDMPGVNLPEPPPFARSTTFNDLVMQLSRCARQAILLESRIDAGLYDYPPPQTQPRDVPRAAVAPQCQPSDHTRIAVERLDDDAAVHAKRGPADILAGIGAELATAMEGVALSDRLASATHELRGAPASQRRTPEPAAVTQADRARQHYLQQGTPPPPSG